MSEINYSGGSTLGWTIRSYSWSDTSWSVRSYNWGYDYANWVADLPLRIGDYYVTDSINTDSGTLYT